MNSTAQPVVLGVAGDKASDNDLAMEFALREARSRGVPIEVVHGCAPRHQLLPKDPWVESERLQHGQHIAGHVAQQLRRLSHDEVPVRVTASSASGVDALLASAASASLVVLQARSTGRGRPGSTIRTLAARANCPVAVLQPGSTDFNSGGVVVGIDERGRSQGALRAAMAHAATHRLPVTAVHAWESLLSGPALYDVVPPSADELALAHDSAALVLSEALAGSLADPRVELRPQLARGSVVEVLRQVAQDAVLLVIGRHANSRVTFHALGHATRALLEEAPCSLLVVPPIDPFRRGSARAQSEGIPLAALA